MIIFEEDSVDDFALNYLSKLNISVDVDISYINFGKYSMSQNETIFELFDVYNNGNDLGGELRVVHDRFVAIDKNDAIRLTESALYPKIVYRKRFEDITLRIGLIVRCCASKSENWKFCIFLWQINCTCDHPQHV